MNRDEFLYFDIEAFTKDFKKLMGDVLEVEGKFIAEDMRDRLREIPFRKDIVRLAGGTVTSDAARRITLMRSIEFDVNRRLGRKVMLTIMAMRKNFKESFIGWYYEYGTGEEYEGYPALGYVSHPYRTGQKIVTRSKFLRYGSKKGMWVDQGGNLRITESPHAGDEIVFEDGHTYDTPAYFWFSGTLDRDWERELTERFRYIL
ncbi:MAG: hypothetical protein QXI16_02715 [Sulfolobaceae archaeon]